VSSAAAAAESGLETTVPPTPIVAKLHMVRPEVAQAENRNVLEIRVDDVEEFYAIDMEIRFDPAKVQVADADPETEGIQIQPGEVPPPDFVAANDVNNEEGVIRYVVTQLGSEPAFDGSGLVATVIWEGELDPETELSFGAVTLVNQSALPMKVEFGE
jgi:hypothetical protein